MQSSINTESPTESNDLGLTHKFQNKVRRKETDKVVANFR